MPASGCGGARDDSLCCWVGGGFYTPRLFLVHIRCPCFRFRSIQSNKEVFSTTSIALRLIFWNSLSHKNTNFPRVRFKTKELRTEAIDYTLWNYLQRSKKYRKSAFVLAGDFFPQLSEELEDYSFTSGSCASWCSYSCSCSSPSLLQALHKPYSAWMSLPSILPLTPESVLGYIFVCSCQLQVTVECFHSASPILFGSVFWNTVFYSPSIPCS